MLADWKDRIDGIKRIVIALGVMSLCAVMSQKDSTQAAGTAAVAMLRTQNGQFANCSSEELETKVGRFGCAVVMKPKVTSSSIQFLSANDKEGDAMKRNLPVFKQPKVMQ